MLGDTETEVAGLGEVALAELVLLDLEATLEDLLSLGTTDGDVNGDLLVTADTEGTDGVTGLACGSVNPTSSSCSLLRDASGCCWIFTYCRRESDRSAARAPWRHE